MSFDSASYVIGKENGEGRVVIEEGEDYNFLDIEGDGNIEIEEVENV